MTHIIQSVDSEKGSRYGAEMAGFQGIIAGKLYSRWPHPVVVYAKSDGKFRVAKKMTNFNARDSYSE